MKIFLLSIFMLLFAPCNSSKKISRTVLDNSKVVITYQCGECFGRCPIYKLSINGEKKMATFTGEKNTEKIGIYTKSISDNELNTFVATFDTAKFNSLENDYLGPIVDFPIKIISYSNNGIKKTIKNRSGAPESLNAIDKMLGEYAESAGWKKVSEVAH